MACMTTGAFGDASLQNRCQPLKQGRRSEPNFSSGGTIVGSSIAILVFLTGGFGVLHGVTTSVFQTLDSIAIVSPEDRARVTKKVQSQDFSPEKAFRLNPLVASYAPSEAKKYLIIPSKAHSSAEMQALLLASKSSMKGALQTQTDKLARATNVSSPASNEINAKAVATTFAATPKAPGSSVYIASLNTTTTEERFNLVMRDSEIGAPLPTTKSENSKRQLPSGNKAEIPPPVRALAYARPDVSDEDSGLPPRAAVPHIEAGVAYYDISAHTIYLPDGARLEAHSGNGKYKDDPRYASVKDHGPTPPNTYKLSMRESLFHGVPALRLTPADGINKFGRVGLLAHTYLRRRPGDSAGCIAVKDYYRFLKYYQRGEIHTLVIVPKFEGSKPTTLASLFDG